MLHRLPVVATFRGMLLQVTHETSNVLSDIPMSCFTPPDVIVQHGITVGENYAIKIAGVMFHRRSTIWVVDRRDFYYRQDLINAGIAAKIGFLDGVGENKFLLGMETIEALEYIFLVSLIAAPNMTAVAKEIVDFLRLDMKDVVGGVGFGYQNFQTDPCQNIKVMPLNGHVPPSGMADVVSSLLVFSDLDRVDGCGGKGYGVGFNLKLGPGGLGTRLALVVMGMDTDRAMKKVDLVAEKMIMRPYTAILTQIESIRTLR